MSTTNCEYIVGGFKIKQYDKSLAKDIIKELFNTSKTNKLITLFPNINPANIDTYINIRENLPDYTYDLVINNLNLLLKEPLSDNAKKELVDELNTLTPIYNQLFIDNPILYQYGSKQQLYAITNNEELKQMTVDEIIQLLKDNKDITPNPNKLAHIDRETQANPFINDLQQDFDNISTNTPITKDNRLESKYVASKKLHQKSTSTINPNNKLIVENLKNSLLSNTLFTIIPNSFDKTTEDVIIDRMVANNITQKINCN